MAKEKDNTARAKFFRVACLRPRGRMLHEFCQADIWYNMRNCIEHQTSFGWSFFYMLTMANEPCMLVQGVSEHFQKSISRHIRPSVHQCEPYNAKADGRIYFLSTMQPTGSRPPGQLSPQEAPQKRPPYP